MRKSDIVLAVFMFIFNSCKQATLLKDSLYPKIPVKEPVQSALPTPFRLACCPQNI